MNPIITYYPSGKIQYQVYYNDLNQYHNENGPAFIEYFQNGNKYSETYYINGKWHNAKGYAHIIYYITGKIELKSYYLNDREINVKNDEEFEKYIKRLNLS